jgi:hypothetical protein
MLTRVIVHGVYRVRYDEATLRAQLLDYYCKSIDADPNVTDFMGRVIPLVLMDVSVLGVDERFEVGEFTQEMPGAPKEAWQVAYDEALLSADGTAVLAPSGVRKGNTGGPNCVLLSLLRSGSADAVDLRRILMSSARTGECEASLTSSLRIYLTQGYSHWFYTSRPLLPVGITWSCCR